MAKKNNEDSIEVGNSKTAERKKLFIETFVAKANNVQMTCKAINIARSTYYKWCTDDEDFKNEVDDIEQGDVDNAESALKKQILEGNITAIIFYLKTKGKARGYIEQHNVNNTNTNFNVEKLDSPEAIQRMSDELDKEF